MLNQKKNREKRRCLGWLHSDEEIVIVLLHFIIQQLSANISTWVIITHSAVTDMLFSA